MYFSLCISSITVTLSLVPHLYTNCKNLAIYSEPLKRSPKAACWAAFQHFTSGMESKTWNGAREFRQSHDFFQTTGLEEFLEL